MTHHWAFRTVIVSSCLSLSQAPLHWPCTLASTVSSRTVCCCPCCLSRCLMQQHLAPSPCVSYDVQWWPATQSLITCPVWPTFSHQAAELATGAHWAVTSKLKTPGRALHSPHNALAKLVTPQRPKWDLPHWIWEHAGRNKPAPTWTTALISFSLQLLRLVLNNNLTTFVPTTHWNVTNLHQNPSPIFMGQVLWNIYLATHFFHRGQLMK